MKHNIPVKIHTKTQLTNLNKSTPEQSHFHISHEHEKSGCQAGSSSLINLTELPYIQVA